MFERVVDTKYVIHCGATNSGKTYNALLALKEKKSGAYLAPLRLLAWEVYEKLNEDGYLCDLLTGEESMVVDGATFVSSTIEMLDYDKKYDTIVIDECFMIGDSERGKSWLKALLDSNAKEIHVIINEEGLRLIEKILTLTNRKFEVKEYEMLQKFTFSEHPKHLNQGMPDGGVFVTFSRTNVLLNKIKLQNMGRKAGVLYGSLPPEVKKVQIQKFISGEFDCIVTTDVIGMGLNLPAKWIVFLDVEKFDGTSFRYLTTQEVRQISGRVGRYGISDDRCFVSADTKQKLDFIKDRYDGFYEVKKAYIGFDFRMFSNFPEEMSVADRILTFSKIDFIPNALKEYVSKESIGRYIDIAPTVDKKNFSLQVKWIFLTAPIKENNKEYFKNSVKHYAKECIINPPTMHHLHMSDIRELENKISEIELYLNISRHLNHDAEDRERIKEKKNNLIENLSSRLLEKKLTLTKKCKLCPTNLSITHPYPYCDSCYKEKVRRDFDYDYFDDFD